MSESIRQQKNPQGLGIGSVPVLFSLRNVQPSIVNGKGKFKTNEPQPIERESGKSVASVSATIPAASSTPVKSTTKSNRPYNVAVGLLILAVFLLVLRNTQGKKTNSKESIASTSSQQSLSVQRPVADSKVELQAPPIPKSNGLTPIDLGPSLASLPNLANPNGAAALPDLANASSEPVRSSDSLARQESIDPTGNTRTDSSNEEQSLVQAKPPMLLLPSTKPVTTEETDSAAASTDSGNRLAPSGIRFPEPRLATNPESRQTNAEFNNPLAGGSGNAIVSNPSVVDTNSPLMTTRELIDLHERGKQNTPPSVYSGPSLPRGTDQGIPATPISSVTPAYENYTTSTTSAFQPNVVNDSRMMSGRSYPPLPKEYPALTIPAYEQNALSGRQEFSNSMQTTQLIRQPANASNRYQSISPQASTTPIPYTPIAPYQGGNSIGYPPGN